MLTRTALGLSNVCRPEGRIALRLSINRCPPLQQLELWGIDEMVEAVEEQLQDTAAEQDEAPAVGCHQAAQAQCPLAEAGGVCVVQHCEWCGEKEHGDRV